jgi:hypothetical protein
LISYLRILFRFILLLRRKEWTADIVTSFQTSVCVYVKLHTMCVVLNVMSIYELTQQLIEKTMMMAKNTQPPLSVKVIAILSSLGQITSAFRNEVSLNKMVCWSYKKMYNK